jgi:fructokinase
MAGPHGRVVLVGEVLIDFLGEGGAMLEEARLFRPSPGGAPANAAVAAARAGAAAAFVGCVGDDAFGRLLRGALERAGVDTATLRVHGSLFTTLAFVLPQARGDSGFQFMRGADAALGPEDLPPLSGVAAVGCGGVSLSAPAARAATLAALAAGREAGALTCFDVNYRPRLWPSAAAAAGAAAEAAAACEVLKCNESELQLLAGADGGVEERAARLLGRDGSGPDAVVVTRAERGALWVGRGGTAAHPGFPVAALDAVGAGDCFLGTLLAAWAAGPPRRAAGLPAEAAAALLRRCCAASALQTTRPGAMAAMPDAAEVDALLAAALA